LNEPLRAGKGSCYEGGVRVPLIIFWPNETPRGSDCAEPVITMDLYPTILEMAGVSRAGTSTADGLSLVPLLRQTGSLPERSLYWHYPHYQHYQQEGTTPYCAIRRGDYRLVEFYDDHRTELYNVRDDVGERNNLAESLPDLIQSLRDELHAWLRSVDAQMPTANPNYDPTKPEHMPPATPGTRSDDRRGSSRRTSRTQLGISVSRSR
jgi:arylsulfatase A